MTASLLVAASVAAFLSAPQGLQRTLDLADGGRADSSRPQASKSLPTAVAPAKLATSLSSLSSSVAAVPAPEPAVAEPTARVTSAVPLPEVPLWTVPMATVPVPTAAGWVVEMPGKFLADSIVVEKGERRMTLFYRGAPVRSYRVALGRNPVGDKVAIGDYRTPEGVYWIIGRNASSKFYKSLAISYPDAVHEARAAELGVNPGGNIMIHGLPPHQAKLGAAHVLADWTEGCIAVTNAEIDEIWRAVQPWSAIHIKP